MEHGLVRNAAGSLRLLKGPATRPLAPTTPCLPARVQPLVGKSKLEARLKRAPEQLAQRRLRRTMRIRAGDPLSHGRAC